MEFLATATLLLCLLLLLRNEMTGAWMQRRIAEIQQWNLKQIDAGTYPETRVDYESIPSYTSLLFNPLVWTYRGAFPTPVSESAGAGRE